MDQNQIVLLDYFSILSGILPSLGVTSIRNRESISIKGVTSELLEYNSIAIYL